MKDVSITPISIILDVEKHINNMNKNKLFYSASELLARGIFKMPFLLEPIFPQVGLVALAGSSDTGKSSFLRQFAISVVTNKSTFLDFKLNTIHRKAIYVSSEDDDIAISFLLHKSKISNSTNIDDYKDLYYIFETQDILQVLKGFLEKNKVDLIVVDAFSDLYGKSMNETNQVRNFLNEYSQIAQTYKCLIIFLHHTGKRTEDLIPSKNNLLGSQGFEAKMRLVIELRNDRLDMSKKHLCIVKGNYLPREMKNESYVLTFEDDLTFTMTNERVLFEELLSSNNNEVRNRIKELYKNGKSQSEISKIVKLSQATISRMLK